VAKPEGQLNISSEAGGIVSAAGLSWRTAGHSPIATTSRCKVRLALEVHVASKSGPRRLRARRLVKVGDPR
jgi:hypothetical protein